MNDTNGRNLPATQTADNYRKAAEQYGGFEAMLKFKKGEYFVGEDEVPLGTEYIAHMEGWTLGWIKFRDQQVVERKMYRVEEGGRIPDRDELDENDHSKWPIGINNAPADPWVFQMYVPFENRDTGEVVVFVTSSYGGKKAVSLLSKAWQRRLAINGKHELPVIRLAKGKMKTRMYGDVPCPNFLPVVGWTGDEHQGIRDITPPSEPSRKDELDDEIPF
jgi:hypothetical protein